ncbi:SusD family protein [Chitinophaga costaii]|uniref:SusD family protein n=1 Tax=Chitinophaga costaii TaxID=1335309 RepID=A0A1C4EF79_9BACT|nr:RagB/SusD family nutrient uptake outer membrane protein [Chitinophaga costaii]PUZ23863.1 RagB/SusD family nutrient uptake outer membrane protein [Chitinophaga costaii]SCC42234.1 SusD family protein [Chitinophaga costaii]
MRTCYLTYIIYLLTASLLLAGCKKKYLDKPPDNQRTPKTVADYSAILNGEGWNRDIYTQGSGVSLYFLDMLTPDIAENIDTVHSDLVDGRGPYSAFYTWQNYYDAQYDERHSPSSTLNDTWLGLYRIITACNVITDAGQQIQGNAADRQFLLGDACFNRALAYYFLVNIFGHPYDPANPDDPMGIPIKTTSTIENVNIPRSTVGACYDQILTDLLTATQCLSEAGKTSTVFHYSPAAVYLLYSRIYLYMHNWEQAVAYADKCLAIHPVLYDISNKNFLSGNYYTSPFFTPQNPEIIYTYYYDLSASEVSIFGEGESFGFQVAPALLQQYATGDQRPPLFFYKNYYDQVSYVAYTFLAGGTYYNYSFRSAEAYLNRAEANAHLGETGKALEDINLLQRNRVKNVTPLSITDPQALLQAIALQRRKELAFQLHSWFDLRRTDQPAITHYFTPVINDTLQARQQFILQKNDPGYTLEIPAAALQANPALKPLGLTTRLPQ